MAWNTSPSPAPAEAAPFVVQNVQAPPSSQPSRLPQAQNAFGQPRKPPSSGFVGITGAKASRTSLYFLPGQYVVKIERVCQVDSQSGQKFFCIESSILDVVDPLIHMHAPGFVTGSSGSKPHVVGDRPTQLIKQGQSFAGNVMAFLVAATGYDSSQITDEIANACCNEEPSFGPVQPLAGTVLEVKAVLISTKPKPGYPNGTPFTAMSYLRQIPPTEVKKNLDPDLVERFFPNGFLDSLIAATNASA